MYKYIDRIPTAAKHLTHQENLFQNLSKRFSIIIMATSGQHAYRCSICLGNYDNPKVISCGHTFCKNCLQQLPIERRRYKTTLQCPECREKVELPSSGRVEDFPTNFAIKGAIELSVDGYALQSLCVKHEKNQDLFCNTCSLCICVDCFVEKHKSEEHDVTSTTDQANETVEQLRSAEVCYKQSQCTILFDRISKFKDTNAENARAIVGQINEERRQMIEEINRQADQLVKVVEVVTEEKKHGFEDIKQIIESKYNENLEKAKQCSSLVDEISKFGLSQDRFDKGRDLCAIQEKGDMEENCDDKETDDYKIQDYDDFYKCDDDTPIDHVPPSDDDVPPSDDDVPPFDDDVKQSDDDVPLSNDSEGEYDDKDNTAIDEEFVSSSFHQLEQFNNTLEFQENPENNFVIFGLIKQSKTKLVNDKFCGNVL